MLTLPFLILMLLLCIALIYTVQGTLILDNALAATCRELSENSYLLQQAAGLGIEGKILGDLAVAGISSLWANRCLNKYLSEYPEIRQAIEWSQTNGPFFSAEGVGDIAEIGGDADNESNDDDVILILSFTPAKLNGVTAILPDAWKVIFAKRQRAWLTGRSLLPERGLEQAAGQKEQGPLVYITRWGIRYHTNDCRYLAKSKIPAYLNRLAAAYDPCQVCHPPSRSLGELPAAG